MAAPTSIAEMKNPPPREAQMPAVVAGFGSLQSYELMVRQAKGLALSTLVPASYRSHIEKKDGVFEENPSGLPNCIVALNMAQRMGADPLMVMQNLYIVEGRPSWSSQFIIAAINSCGRYSPLRFTMSDPEPERDVAYTTHVWKDGANGRRVKEEVTKTVKIRNRTCTAWAVEKATGERLESPTISIEMAVAEGWLTKNGSKWQTMPDVMLRYRAAAFFGKLYAPELLMGLQTAEEAGDIIDAEPTGQGAYAVPVETLRPDPAPAANAPANVDPSTGEILDADPQPEQAMQEQQQSTGDAGGPTFEDAIAAVKEGDFDMARDMARSFSDGQKKAVEQAIANRMGGNAGSEQGSGGRRGRGERSSLNLE